MSAKEAKPEAVKCSKGWYDGCWWPACGCTPDALVAQEPTPERANVAAPDSELRELLREDRNG